MHEAEIEKEFNALLDEVLDAVSHEEVDKVLDAVTHEVVEKEVEVDFGTSVPVSATQRTNLSVYDAFKMIVKLIATKNNLALVFFSCKTPNPM
jgi:hypothetical protein